MVFDAETDLQDHVTSKHNLEEDSAAENVSCTDSSDARSQSSETTLTNGAEHLDLKVTPKCEHSPSPTISYNNNNNVNNLNDVTVNS